MVRALFALVAILFATSGCAAIVQKYREASSMGSSMEPGHKYQTFSMSAGSMLPTIQIHDIMLVDESAYDLAAPENGDIVVFDPPVDSPDPWIKRVVAGPGDTFSMAGGTMRVNGKIVREPYLKKPALYGLRVTNRAFQVRYGDKGWIALDATAANVPPDAAWDAPDRLPAKCFIVLGDNRNDSEDSHVWGCAQFHGKFFSGPAAGDQGKLLGKVVKVVHPDG